MRRMLAALIALAGLALLQPCDAAPFRKGTSLQIYAFPSTENGHYAADPYPGRHGAEAHFDIDRLHLMGFDHVRLPVDTGPLLDDPDGRQWRQFYPRFQALLERLHRDHLGIIVTLLAPALAGQIPEDQLDGLAGERFQRYAALTERFASALGEEPFENLALEPMNEPQRDCQREGAVDWTAYQDVLIPRLRAKAPRLWLGLTGGCWSKIEGLASLRPDQVRDPRTFISVHFYDPFLFTHQGAEWTLDIMPLIQNLPYPARGDQVDTVLAQARRRAAELESTKPAIARSLPRAEDSIRQYFREHGPDLIRSKMELMAAWCRQRAITPDRVVFTEFGAMRSIGDDRSRARWLADVSNAIASRGWGETLWVLRDGPFAIDGETGTFDPALPAAMGLKRP